MAKEEALNKIKELEKSISEFFTGYKDDPPPFFLLSADEYEKYRDLIPHKKNRMVAPFTWLPYSPCRLCLFWWFN